jgi:aldehyde:ferredoxin oxidoreductase
MAGLFSEYYRERGWDPVEGPTPDKLILLGLDS